MRNEKRVKNKVGNFVKGRGQLEDLIAEGRMLLKEMLQNQDKVHKLYLFGSG